MGMYIDAVHRLVARHKPHNLVQTGTSSNSMGSWNASNVSGTSGLAGPNGQLAAARYVETATTGVHRLSNNGGFAATQLPTFGNFTLSLSVKPEERTWVYLEVASSNSQRVHFDLANKVIGTKLIAAFAWMREEDNGFMRIGMGFTLTTLSGFLPIVGLADADATISYLGDITKGLTLYGPMIVRGIKDVPYNLIVGSGGALAIRG